MVIVSMGRRSGWALWSLMASAIVAAHSAAAPSAEAWQQVVVGRELTTRPDPSVVDRPWWELVPDTKTDGFWLFRGWHRSDTVWAGVLYDSEGRRIVGPLELPKGPQQESQGEWDRSAFTVTSDGSGNIHAAYVRRSDVEAMYSDEGSGAQAPHRLVVSDRSGRMVSLVDVPGSPDPPRLISGIVVLPDGGRALSWEWEFSHDVWMELRSPDGDVRLTEGPTAGGFQYPMSVDWLTGRLLVQHQSPRDHRARIVAYDSSTGEELASYQIRGDGLLGSDSSGRLYTVAGPAGWDGLSQVRVLCSDRRGRVLRRFSFPRLSSSEHEQWRFALSRQGDVFVWDIVAWPEVVVWRLPAGRLIKARHKERREPRQDDGRVRR